MDMAVVAGGWVVPSEKKVEEVDEILRRGLSEGGMDAGW